MTRTHAWIKIQSPHVTVNLYRDLDGDPLHVLPDLLAAVTAARLYPAYSMYTKDLHAILAAEELAKVTYEGATLYREITAATRSKLTLLEFLSGMHGFEYKVTWKDGDLEISFKHHEEGWFEEPRVFTLKTLADHVADITEVGS